MNHLGILLKCLFWFRWPGMTFRVCISSKLPAASAGTGSRTKSEWRGYKPCPYGTTFCSSCGYNTCLAVCTLNTVLLCFTHPLLLLQSLKGDVCVLSCIQLFVAMGCHFLLQGIFHPRDHTWVSLASRIGRRVLSHSATYTHWRQFCCLLHLFLSLPSLKGTLQKLY